MKYKYGIFFAVLLLVSWQIKAQVFGGNPPSTKWMQLGNDTFQIIFPKDQYSTAQKVASLITWQSRKNNSLGNIISKAPIVLQSEVTYSNGYVGLGPFRSEFYLMPPLDPFALGSQDWSENLAIHEFRHIQQYNNFNVGLSKTFGKIFGQNGRALANSMAIPDWFFEGDAVYNETKLSQQGRGRLPQFMNQFAALFLEGKNYSYEKWRNGSYKDYVPNHYALGYILVAYGYEKYGVSFWQKVTKDAASYHPLFYPFQSAIRKYAGIDFQQYVQDAFRYYVSNTSKRISTDSSVSKIQSSQYESYSYPVVTDSLSYAVKTSYRQIPIFVRMDSSHIFKKIAASSITYDNYFSSNGNSIVYSAWKPDMRWGNRQYSPIRILDISSKKETVVGKNKKWFNPDISVRSDSLLVVESDSIFRNHVLLLNRNATILKKIQGNVGELFSFPKFYKDGFVVFVRKNSGDMSLRLYHFSDSSAIDLMPFGNRLLGYPNLQKDTLFFTSSANGKDALYALDFKSQHFFEVAESNTGVYGGGIMKGKIVGAIFTSEGDRLKTLTPQWHPKIFTQSDSLQLLYFHHLKDQYHLLQQVNLDTTWQMQHYPKLSHPFNFHSLQPEWDDPNYSLSLFGENILNTVQSQISYNYNRNEKYSSVGVSTAYGGWYLMPVLSVSRTFNRQAYTNAGWLQKWNEWNAGGGFSLPLNFSGGKMYRYLTYQSMMYLNNVEWKWTGVAKQNYQDKTFTYWSQYLRYSSYAQQAVQQIYPHWGYSVAMQYRYGLSANADQYLLSGSVYLPGLFDSHSLVLNAAYQRRDTLGNYSFSNGFPISRGYQLINYPQMWKVSGNYHFPIWYPDCGWGNIAYILRIRGNIFYDYSQLKSLRTQRQYQLRSAGAEIYFDTKWWNQQNVTFGFRYSYMQDHSLLGTGASRWEFILPVSIF